MKLMCINIFCTNITGNICAKNYSNRKTFAQVTAKNVGGVFFLRYSVDVVTTCLEKLEMSGNLPAVGFTSEN